MTEQPAWGGGSTSGQQPQAPAPPRSGHPIVDAALDDLDEAADRPPAEQVAPFEAAYHRLHEALNTIDEG